MAVVTRLEEIGKPDRREAAAPYRLACARAGRDRSVVEIGPERFAVGGRKVGVIAGPCAVEDRDQLFRLAEAARSAGCVGLRGGAYKPRTSPYSFHGLGEAGLELLAEARRRTGLAVVTEVVGVEQLETVSAYADVLQVGSRNMQHYPLLEAVGRQDKPVLLKRGMSAQVDEWLLAAEYVMAGGNEKVILCERGIRTFERHVRNTLPLASVPQLRNLTHLPVVVDPSHGTGRAHLVPAMCLAAVAAGADGLLIECHPDPPAARSDGEQSITPEALAELMGAVRRVAEAVGREV